MLTGLAMHGWSDPSQRFPASLGPYTTLSISVYSGQETTGAERINTTTLFQETGDAQSKMRFAAVTHFYQWYCIYWLMPLCSPISLLYICVHAVYWLFSLHAFLQREDRMKPPTNTSFKPVRTRYCLWMCAHTPISSSPALITTCNLVWFYGIHQSYSSISEVIYYYIFCSWLELMKNQEQFPIRSLNLESMKWGKSTFALASEIL